MGNKVAIDIEAKDRATKPLKDVQDAYERFKKRGMAGVTIGASAAVTAKAFSLVGQAIGSVTDVMADSVRMAAEEESNIARLDRALQNSIAGWNGNRESIEGVIAEREKLAFSDGELRDSLGDLVTRTHDVNEAFALQRQAMDLSRAKGMDLATAAGIIGKVYGGNVGILKRYGIAVTEGADATEALAEVSRATAGQAKAYADGATGSLESLQIAVQDVQEDIGQQLLPAIRDVSVWLRDDFIPAAKAAGDAIGWVDENTPALMTAPDILKVVGDSLQTVFSLMTEGPVTATRSLNDFRAAERDSLEAGWELSKAAGAAGGAVADLGGAADDTGDELSGVKVQGRKAADALRDVEEAADDARDALFGSSKGPQELTLELQNARVEGRDLEAKLRDLEGKKPTKDVRQDIRDTKLEIIENQKQVIELEGDLVRLGKVSLGKHEQTIRDLGYGWGDASDELRAYLRLLGKVPGVKLPGSRRAPADDPNGSGRASGGPVAEGNVYRVGEKGEEWFVPDKDGTIIPNDMVRSITSGQGGASPVAAAAGGGDTFNFYFSAPVMTPGVMQQFADQVAPAITRWQQARGL